MICPKRLWMLALLPLILAASRAPTSFANATPVEVRLVAGHDNPAIVGSDVVHVPVVGIHGHPNGVLAHAGGMVPFVLSVGDNDVLHSLLTAWLAHDWWFDGQQWIAE